MTHPHVGGARGGDTITLDRKFGFDVGDFIMAKVVPNLKRETTWLAISASKFEERVSRLGGYQGDDLCPC